MIADEKLAELEAKARDAESLLWCPIREEWAMDPDTSDQEEFTAAANPTMVLELVAEITRLKAKAESDRIEGHALWEQTVYRLEKERDNWRDKAVRFKQIAIQALHYPIPPEYNQMFRDNIDELLA